MQLGDTDLQFHISSLPSSETDTPIDVAYVLEFKEGLEVDLSTVVNV